MRMAATARRLLPFRLVRAVGVDFGDGARAILEIGGFTGTLNVVYRSLTPLHQPVRMRSWIDREEGVKTFIKGTMHTTDPDGTDRLCAEAEGIFIRPKTSILEQALERSGANKG